jgi:hypothetical protein
MDVIAVLSSLADRFPQACIGTAIVGNTHGNAPFGLSPRNVRCRKRVVVFSFNEGPYIPNRCALMSSRRWRTGSQVRVGTTLRYFLAVAGTGTLSAAAEQLGTEHTTASAAGDLRPSRSAGDELLTRASSPCETAARARFSAARAAFFAAAQFIGKMVVTIVASWTGPRLSDGSCQVHRRTRQA